MKKSTNIRYKTDWIDFCQDGMKPKERIKGKDKKYLGKWSRKKFFETVDSDWENENEKYNDS